MPDKRKMKQARRAAVSLLSEPFGLGFAKQGVPQWRLAKPRPPAPKKGAKRR
jgi:hypothetical protein